MERTFYEIIRHERKKYHNPYCSGTDDSLSRFHRERACPGCHLHALCHGCREYNDNIEFEREDPLSDFVTNVKPAFRLDYDTELMKLETLASVNFSRYAEETHLDKEDQSYRLRGEYRATERSTFSGRLAYIRDTTLESGPESAAEGIDDAGIFYFRTDRKRYNADLGYEYRLNELSDISIDYSFRQTDYAFEENSDFDKQKIALSCKRRLKDQVSSVAAKFSYDHRNSETGEVDNYNLAGEWEYNIKETLRLTSSLGVRFTREEYDDGSPQDETWRGTADIQLRKRMDEQSALTVGYRRDLKTDSSGKAVNVDELYCNFSRKLTGRLRAGLASRFYYVKEDNEGEGAEDSDRYFFEVTPSLAWRITENYYLKLAYSYSTEYDNGEEDDPGVDRNRVWLILSFNFPGKW
ncbi:hypothetical protein DENIS_1873 [Desulfonema ishimotonii]|uniref:TIGR03016 family PEP-CTERM system-associated outer membrane protein n=1 Tax=Desulfonema ishimotonii TaxID=45657 RepID=A0A401FVD1_9BACT|nr:outer membrane beta-barrel protein [Desulfonema ishimotonii]GBC60913.1 hypothetical protein DENIS_1873 [Desulfonema ishimotonii]